MKLTRREPPEIGISFLDTITCGVGAIILLMTVTTTRPQEAPPSDSDPRAVQISQLQRQLFAAQAELGKVTSEAASKVSTAALSESELKKVKAQIAALLAAQAKAAGQGSGPQFHRMPRMSPDGGHSGGQIPDGQPGT